MSDLLFPYFNTYYGYKTNTNFKVEKWLKSLGLEYKRTVGGHEIWDYPDDSLLRPVVFRGAKKDIPGCHIHTNLKTLDIDYKDFQKQIQKF